MKFNWIDLLVALFVIKGMITGHRRGLSGELLRFLGIFIGLILSFKFYEQLAERIMGRFPMDHNVAIGCAFAAIFLAVLFFFYMLNQTVHRMTQLPPLAAVERAGGAVLGGAKALLLAGAVVILLALVKVQAISSAVSEKSFFGPLAISAVPGVYKFAVRVYPSVQSLPAEEVIEKLPAVRARTELDYSKRPDAGMRKQPSPRAADTTERIQ